MHADSFHRKRSPFLSEEGLGCFATRADNIRPYKHRVECGAEKIPIRVNRDFLLFFGLIPVVPHALNIVIFFEHIKQSVHFENSLFIS